MLKPKRGERLEENDLSWPNPRWPDGQDAVAPVRVCRRLPGLKAIQSGELYLAAVPRHGLRGGATCFAQRRTLHIALVFAGIAMGRTVGDSDMLGPGRSDERTHTVAERVTRAE